MNSVTRFEVPMKSVFTALTLVVAGSLAAADWPGFRGTGDGTSRESKLPTKWSYTISRAAPTPCVDADGVYCFELKSR
jgi:hypothetical protein